MARPRTPKDWEARYRDGELPWDIGRPGEHLQQAVAGGLIKPCELLEIGCGTGTDAVWLAEQGFTVTATDVANTALDKARARADEAGAKIRFVEGAFPDDVGAFDVAYDRGVLHIADSDAARQAFAQSVARCLRPDGLWLNLSGSTDGPPRDHGPPRLSALDIIRGVERDFEVLSLMDTMFEANVPTPARGFWLVARKRRQY